MPIRPSVLYDVIRNPSAFLLKLSLLSGDIGEYKAGPVHIVCVNAPDLVNEVLTKQAKCFRKMSAVRTLKVFTGDGLLVNEGAVWERHRKASAPAFHLERVAQYQKLFVSSALDAISQWKDGDIIDLGAAISHLTLRIVARTLFSCELDDVYPGMVHDIERSLAFVNKLSARGAFPGGRWFIGGKTQALSAIDRVKTNVGTIVADRRRLQTPGNDLLGMLMQVHDSESALADEEIVDEAITMFVAGHETVAVALIWALVLIGQHPEVEMRLREEVLLHCRDGSPEYDDMQHLVLGQSVVKEVLRLFPPAFVIGRETSSNVPLGEFELPPNAWVMISPYVTHRNPRYFEEPNMFVPERFVGSFEKTLPRGAYIPFGWGARVCIGSMFALLEMHAVISAIVSRISLEIQGTLPGTNPMITLNPDRTVWAKVKKLRP
jgi:cytochrome P450